MPRRPATSTSTRPAEVPPARGRGGRPSRDAAERLGGRILEVATGLFLANGYGATSIEMVARAAGIAKRTFYHRYPDKAALFGAVVRGVVAKLRPPADASLAADGPLEPTLIGVARAILRASLSPEALSLFRVIVAESGRFPELAATVAAQGASQEGIARIAALLVRDDARTDANTLSAGFAAAQFLFMVMSVPQRRALGLGPAMSEEELEAWARDTVALFLRGWRGAAPAA